MEHSTTHLTPYGDETREHRSISPLPHSDSDTTPEAKHTMYPPIPLDLSQHKLAIALNWLPIILSSGILPIVLYFTLHYTTTLELNIILTIPLVIMGVASVFNLSTRTYLLVRSSSTCRPLGAEHNRWAFDWFHWNFMLGFVVLTVIISLGVSLKSLVVVSLPTTILLAYVSLELILAEVAVLFDIRVPWRMSSVGRGERLKPAVFIIAEDICAVDGGLGQKFRRAWIERYEADTEFQALLKKLDWLWGVSGLVVVAIVWGCVFGFDNKEIGFACGWALPWIWAGFMTLLTIYMAKDMLRRQRQRAGYSQVSYP